MSEPENDTPSKDPPPLAASEESNSIVPTTTTTTLSNPVTTTAAYLLEDVDFSIQGILNSIQKRAFFDRDDATLVEGGGGGGWSVQAPPRCLVQNPHRMAALEQLVLQGAKWMEIKTVGGVPVQRLAEIPYGSAALPSQRLDIYFPRDDDNNNDNNTTTSTADKRPVYIHIHGGGWSRGGKDSVFYGGPAMCQNATAEAGCISVAIGYRLGKYPDFLHDAANAILWIYQNLESLGGDMEKVFLSGHSAGGHISSLLILRHDTFLEPLGIPLSFFKGLVLVSGVYDLFRPMQVNVMDAKNKWFNLAYVLPAFGTDEKLKREASPLLLLDPQKDTSLLGSAARSVAAKLPSLSFRKRFSRTAVEINLSPRDEEDENKQGNNAPFLEWKPTDNNTPPPTLILNATYDMGLQENGRLMAEALSEYTDVRYRIIEGSDHASICWHETTSKVVADFVRSICHPPKKRRGKRDKSPKPPPPSAADVAKEEE